MSEISSDIKICQNCGKEFLPKNKRNLNKFCSRSCIASFVNHSNKGKIKRSQKAIDKQKQTLSNFWDSEESTPSREDRSQRAKIQSEKPQFKKIFVDAVKDFHNDPVRSQKAKQKMSKTVQQKVLDGTHNVWRARNIRSYAELYTEKILQNYNLNFEIEKFVSFESLGILRRGGYFLDFYFPDQKVDLEIDGNQHKYRKDSDIKRDNLLISQDIRIKRIPWINLKNEKEREFFFKTLLDFIHELK
jgi:very-short-patch-repair endonuclease